MKKLTTRQQAVYGFIEDFIREHGYSPSIRDICAGLNIRSTSTIHTHIANLEDKGYLRKKDNTNRSLVLTRSFESAVVDVPIIGRIQAGEPIFASENVEGSFPVPQDRIGRGEHFMLRVQGDSMIDAGICNHDFVLVEQKEVAEDGEIVVALIENEATVKTFFRESKGIRLQPANDAFSPIISRDVQILGTVRGVFRFI
ncbi:MAG TPA: transcriptional repressor LexA [Tissierellia bacterium]|nr:transcriptional repressor LexA [Tissierellia bacterium]